MDVIDRIKASWDTLVKPYPIQGRGSSPSSEDKNLPYQLSGRYSPGSPPNLREIIQEIGPLPPYSIIIGGCDDHSHLFLDLSDPAPGSIMIVGNEKSGAERLLESILYSSTFLNSPRRVRYSLVVSPNMDVEYLQTLPHCYKITNVNEDESIDLVYELADIADYRRSNHQSGSAIILAIQNLPELLATMNEDMVNQLKWLIQVGPEVLIWTIAGIDTNSLMSVDPEVINQFGTRLIGSVDTIDTIKYLTGTEDSQPTRIVPGSQFSVMFNEDWIRFWIPSVQEVVP